MDKIVKVEIPKPEIPKDWDFKVEDKNFDELVFGWRRLTTDVISHLWIFYNKLKNPGQRTDLPQNCVRLPSWENWLKSKGIAPNTPLNHFKRLGWIEGKPIVSLFTGNNEWYTPKEYIELVKKVMGKIDLDPASCDEAQKIIKAEEYYTKEDNGLEQSWFGNIWLNPPYSQPLVKYFTNAVVSKISDYNQIMIGQRDYTQKFI